MRTVKDILAERQKAYDAAKALNDRADSEKRGFTEEEAKTFEGLRADMRRLKAEAERVQELDTVGGELSSRQTPPGGAQPPGRENTPPAGAGEREVQATVEQRALAIQAWLRSQVGEDLEPEHEAACRATGLNPRRRYLDVRLARTEGFERIQRSFRDGPRNKAEERALSAITSADGGAITSPDRLVTNLEVNLLAYGGVLDAAEIMRTADRDPIRWPTVNDTSNKGRRLGEAKPVAEVKPTFARVSWDAYKYTSDEILVPFELLSRTPFDLPGKLGSMLGERLGRKLADDFTTGTGVDQPRGIVTAATTFSAAAATSIAWDDLEKLISAVDPAYRIGAGFMFHDTIRKELKLLKDGLGRPLWADQPNGSQPTALKGYPYFVNQSMASTMASGTKTVLFGRLSAYKVRQVDTVRMYRLVERHRENDEDAFLAFTEADGNLLDAGTAPVKVLTH